MTPETIEAGQLFLASIAGSWLICLAVFLYVLTKPRPPKQ